MRFPNTVHTDLLHCFWNQMNGNGGVYLFALTWTRQTQETSHVLGYLLRFISNHYFGSRSGNTDHLINGLLLLRKEVDPTNVKNVVKWVWFERQPLCLPQEKVYWPSPARDQPATISQLRRWDVQAIYVTRFARLKQVRKITTRPYRNLQDPSIV